MSVKPGTAKIETIRRWSPVWIVPVVTLLIGIWIVFYHYRHLGPEISLITHNAAGIVGGKTPIKSRNVTVGVVENIMLTDDLQSVRIGARLNPGMEKLLGEDSVFWIVKPQVGREGVTGLETLLSGSYIELRPGSHKGGKRQFELLDAPPLAPPDAKGLRVILHSDRAGQLNPGDPVLYRGYRVGSVETSEFNPQTRSMQYQLFISAPYDGLVTSNVRFWKDSGVTFEMSAQGMRVEMGSLTTLFSGGVSFDVPEGLDRGAEVKNRADFQLFDDRRAIQDTLYLRHKDYLLFFSDSIRGLQAGAPVEFRGIRIGTVAEAPYLSTILHQNLNSDYRIPVLIRIEPDRFLSKLGKDIDFEQYLREAETRGLRATLKNANLLTGSLYIDLDFYPGEKLPPHPKKVAGIPLILTVSGGLSQMQQKVTLLLDKLNALPLDALLNQANGTLAESRKTLRDLQTTLANLNQITGSEEMKKLPKDVRQTLTELNRSLQSFQPGAPAYNQFMDDMHQLDRVMRQLEPVLRTLNEKSNALVFEAPVGKDPVPKRAKK